MEYLKIEQIAKKWDISVRRVQLLCADGKIEGAVRFGRAWMIPKNAKKPVDGRTKVGRSLVNENMPLPRKTPFKCFELSPMPQIMGGAESIGAR